MYIYKHVSIYVYLPSLSLYPALSRALFLAHTWAERTLKDKAERIGGAHFSISRNLVRKRSSCGDSLSRHILNLIHLTPPPRTGSSVTDSFCTIDQLIHDRCPATYSIVFTPGWVHGR